METRSDYLGGLGDNHSYSCEMEVEEGDMKWMARLAAVGLESWNDAVTTRETPEPPEIERGN